MHPTTPQIQELKSSNIYPQHKKPRNIPTSEKCEGVTSIHKVVQVEAFHLQLRDDGARVN